MNQIKHGVLQCSILGPVLFLVYINDLPKATEQNTIPISLTDDTGILIKSQNNNEFQNYLNTVSG